MYGKGWTSQGVLVRTLLLQLLQELVVLPPQLCPLGELVLAAGRIELQPQAEVLLLQLPILDGKFGGLDRQLIQYAP